LHRAADPEKDQSYVLHGIRRSILPRLLFPIGGYRKEVIRSIARKVGLPVADKPDSVEICFVPDNDHGALIRRRRPELATVGNFVDTAGNILAPHEGIENYTIGQRKGLNYAAGERRYVLEIVPATNEVVLGDREELLASGLTASGVNWLLDTPPLEPLSCQAKIRYRHTAASATVTATADGGAGVDFAEPQSAVTPGQAVVFYDGLRVLGGGWIESATPAATRSAHVQTETPADAAFPQESPMTRPSAAPAG
jgi:tRNA-specific 2-thiouridylase